MEFHFDVERAMRPAPPAQTRGGGGGGDARVVDAMVLSHAPQGADIGLVVDRMGEASARAQGLGSVITTCERLLASPDQRLFLLSHGPACLGLLKVGSRRLFIRDAAGGIAEIEPLCVLDFYVHEACQRQGVGRQLFEAMLEHEGAAPELLAYDRPSHKLLSFLHKHFGLAAYTPQANNFVVFHAGLPRLAAGRGRGRGRGATRGGGMASISQRPLTRARRRFGQEDESGARNGDALDTLARSHGPAAGSVPAGRAVAGGAAPRSGGDSAAPWSRSAVGAARAPAKAGREVVASWSGSPERDGQTVPATPPSRGRSNQRNASNAMAAILSSPSDVEQPSRRRGGGLPPARGPHRDPAPTRVDPGTQNMAPGASPLSRFVRAADARESSRRALRPLALGSHR